MDKKLSLGFVRVSGGPEDFTGVNIRTETGERQGDDRRGPKASGMLFVDGVPTFLNFGKNYAGARDDYVYSNDHDSAYEAGDRMVMARVPKDRIRERDAYEFFRGLDGHGQPLWTRDIRDRGAVFVHPGRCYRSGISYNEGLKRYL